MEKYQIEYDFNNFEITIRSASYTRPHVGSPWTCDSSDDYYGGWEIDFTAVDMITGEKIDDKRLLAELEQELIKKLEEENEDF
jgi:hypothetical protein